jgi:hypothetical protein
VVVSEIPGAVQAQNWFAALCQFTQRSGVNHALDQFVRGVLPLPSFVPMYIRYSESWSGRPFPQAAPRPSAGAEGFPASSGMRQAWLVYGQG